MKKTIKKYTFAVIASDVVIFTVRDQELQVLLMQMTKEPFTGMWAAPGGLVRPNESVDAAATRLLLEKAAVKDVHLEQLYTFGRVDRDPFGRVVSVAYFALIPEGTVSLQATKEHPRIQWFPVHKLPRLAYDHAEVIGIAVERLRSKLAYTNIVYSLLPNEFTLTQLQTTYELILQEKLDKRNFRKKILSLGLMKKTGKKESDVANRPAALYSFRSRKLQQINVL